MRKQERKNTVNVGFIGLEKAYDRVNLFREALWQVLRMYDLGGKLLSGIKGMYVDSSACVRVKGDECERFRVDSVMREGCIMSTWLFNVYMDGVMKEVKMEIGRRGASFLEDGREGRLSDLLYADNLVLCSELEEDLRVMVGRLRYVEGEE